MRWPVATRSRPRANPPPSKLTPPLGHGIPSKVLIRCAPGNRAPGDTPRTPWQTLVSGCACGRGARPGALVTAATTTWPARSHGRGSRPVAGRSTRKTVCACLVGEGLHPSLAAGPRSSYGAMDDPPENGQLMGSAPLRSRLMPAFPIAGDGARLGLVSGWCPSEPRCVAPKCVVQTAL